VCLLTHHLHVGVSQSPAEWIPDDVIPGFQCQTIASGQRHIAAFVPPPAAIVTMVIRVVVVSIACTKCHIVFVLGHFVHAQAVGWK